MFAPVLLIASLICAAVATILGFDWLTGGKYFGWLAASLFFLVASFLVGHVPGWRRGD